MASLIKKLKAKWNIESNFDFIVIMIVFSLAGMSISFFRAPVFHYLGITEQTQLWIKILVYVPLIIPIYQLNLLFYGFLLGQFDFFWNKEKQLGKFLWKAITRR